MRSTTTMVVTEKEIREMVTKGKDGIKKEEEESENKRIRRKRTEMFKREKQRQKDLIPRLEKIKVNHKMASISGRERNGQDRNVLSVNPLFSTLKQVKYEGVEDLESTILLNKNLSTPKDVARRK